MLVVPMMENTDAHTQMLRSAHTYSSGWRLRCTEIKSHWNTETMLKHRRSFENEYLLY